MEKYFEKVYYYERDAKYGRPFLEYMRDNIRKSDIIVLFCSADTKDAQGVQKELGMINVLEKPIVIPIFENLDHVAQTLGDTNRRGIPFTRDNFGDFLKKLRDALLKITPRRG